MSGQALAGRVLLDRDDDRHAAAGDVLATHQVTRALGRDHEHVDAGRRRDVAEADVEAVAEEERVAVDQVGLDRLGVEVPLHLVRRQDHDQVGLLARLAGVTTRRPSASALARLFEPSGSPTRTSTPESRRDSAWAWPWLP